MPGRTRGETRALCEASREYARQHGLPLDHAVLVSMLDKGEAIHEIIHEHGAFPDLPTARASDLPTPANVFKGGDVIARGYMETLQNREFQGLLQAGTFAPI